MWNSPIEEIKNRLDIINIISPYLKLQKAGANWRALCPFHSEKTPSFFASPSRQVWRCFGCGVGGSIFDFVMQIEGVEFGDALRTLAQKAGVELKRASPWFARLQTERRRLSEAGELATQFFQKQLTDSTAGQKAREYLFERGLKEESIAKWRLGYAPESANSLIAFLQNRGYVLEEIAKAGLTVRTSDGTFDRFRSRIIFPVFDLNSQVIGFGGRIFGAKAKEKDLAKYLNTFNTPLYDKSRVLYGLDKAKLSIRQKGKAVLVEGYLDVILVSQAGCENVVAVSGTALTLFHLKLLKRYTENLLLSFDMDIGGETATRRGIDLAIGEGFQVQVVAMPEGKDPADLVSQDAKMWGTSLENAKSIFDFSFERTLARFDKTLPEGKKEIAKAFLPLVKKIPNRIEQAHWISRISQELQVRDEDVEVELRKVPEEQGSATAVRPPFVPQSGNTAGTRKELLEERVFVLLFRSPELLNAIPESEYPFFSLQGQELLAGMKKNPQFSFEQFSLIFPSDTVELLKHISLKSEVQELEEREELDLSLELKNCLNYLRALHLKEELSRIAQEIKIAEALKDNAKLKELMGQFQVLSHYLHAS